MMNYVQEANNKGFQRKGNVKYKHNNQRNLHFNKRINFNNVSHMGLRK